jgi:hypothetical protein
VLRRFLRADFRNFQIGRCRIRRPTLGETLRLLGWEGPEMRVTEVFAE